MIGADLQDFYTEMAGWSNASLVQTRSSYIPEGKYITKRGKSLIGIVPIIFITFLISLFLFVWLGAPGKNHTPPIITNIIPYFFGDFALFGVLFIIGGWSEFQLMQTIDDIPTAKIDGAAEGLNEINARFVPEKGDAMTSVMSRQQCVYFVTTLWQFIQAGKHSHWEVIGSMGKGIPALMTDGSGYIAIPLYEADFPLQGKDYFPIDAKRRLATTKSLEGMELMDVFKEDFTENEIHEIGLTFDSSRTAGEAGWGNLLKISEIVIPVDTDYFVMGRITGTPSMLNGKPVKLMDRDDATKILTVRNQTRASIEKTDKKLSLASFAIGAVLILLGLWYFKLV